MSDERMEQMAAGNRSDWDFQTGDVAYLRERFRRQLEEFQRQLGRLRPWLVETNSLYRRSEDAERSD
jgi:hypothetical protein